MSQIQQLYRLQQIDTEIRQKKQRLAEVLRAQKETEALLAAREREKTAVSTLKKWQGTHSNLNLELGSLNSKAKSAENRLYSGNVKNPKELTDLQDQIAAMGRQRSGLEEQMLEAMIMVEDAEAEAQAATTARSSEEAQWQQAQADYKEEQNTLALRLHHLLGARPKQVEQIDPKLLQDYERIGQRNGGEAVALLKLNMCQGCRITVSANKVKEVVEGKVTHCGGCGRILVAI
ncbi:MAG: hypothetical protein R3C62_13340 [Chloroflexota bacterium]